jgi:hypothetical protein
LARFALSFIPVIELLFVVVHKDIPIPVMHRICGLGPKNAALGLWIEMGIGQAGRGFIVGFSCGVRKVLGLFRGRCSVALMATPAFLFNAQCLHHTFSTAFT